MNIVTPFPAININTANVHTESARRDNQLREVIPPPVATNSSNAENKALNDGEKARQPSGDASTYDAKGRLEDDKAIQEREQSEQGSEEKSEQQQQEEQKQEQKVAQQEQLELEQIKELKERDTEVRVHEQAHASVGGKYAGSPSYEYQRGPDGTNYAVGGEVQIDVAEVSGDPQATIDKMQTVRAAALAPQEPSSADRAIAADATQKLAAAQAELAMQSREKAQGGDESSSLRIDREGAEDESEAVSTSQTKTAKRDVEVDERATRIANFYQMATSPGEQNNFSAVI